jgi:diguanylate cyclase
VASEIIDAGIPGSISAWRDRTAAQAPTDIPGAPVFAIFIALLHNIGMLALAAVAYGFLLPRLQGMTANVVLGLLFGAGAGLSMLSPVELLPGIQADSRATIVMLAGVFGGPVAALIAGGITAACRVFVGGMGMGAGLAAIGISMALGVATYSIVGTGSDKIRFRHIVALALASPLVGLGALFLPWDVASGLMAESGLAVTLARMIGVLFLGSIMLEHQIRIGAEERVRQLAYVDELSGLANRRAFYSHLTREWKRWERYSENFVVVLIDIDRFKAVNDSYGHPAGDLVIQRLARVMLEESRGSDLVARTGGEEFGLILPYTSSASGYLVAERIRTRVQREVVIADDHRIQFTVSVGISADADRYPSMNKCLSGADHALYEAKHIGRNTAVIDTPSETESAPSPAADQRPALAGGT